MRRLNTGTAYILAAAVAAIAFTSLHAALRHRQVTACQQFARSADTFPVTRVFLDHDSYMWVHFARQLSTRDPLHIRWSDVDNAPAGRPVAWSSGFAWWLCLLGAGHQLFTNAPVPVSIESMAVHAGPIALVLLAALLTGLSIRFRLGAAGAVLILGTVFSPQIFWTFFAARPDHHAFISLFSLATLVLLWLTSLPEAQDRKIQCRLLVASAAAGALTLWTSAVSGIALLLSVGLAALITVTLRGRDKRLAWPNAGGWRIWGAAGAIFTLVLYIMEFAPAHLLHMRLEVIHPIYAVAWLGGGELLSRLAAHARPRTAADYAVLSLALLCVLVPPALVLAGGDRFFALRDPFLLRLHNYIAEFKPYARIVAESPRYLLLDFGATILAIPLAVYLLISRAVDRDRKTSIAFLLVPALCMLALTLYQYRWASLLSIALIVLLSGTLFLGRKAFRGSKTAGGMEILILAALAAQVLYFATEELKEASTHSFQTARGRTLGREIILRDVARRLRMLHGDEELIVLSGPPDTPALAWHGRLRGIGSLYWENVEGLKAAADILTAGDERQARTLIAQRNIDYVVLFLRSNYVGELFAAKHGSADTEAVRNTLGYRLLNPELGIPRWLEPVHYSMPFRDLDGFPDNVRIYRVRR